MALPSNEAQPQSLPPGTYFEIAVHNAVLVAVVHAFQYLLHAMRRVCFRVELSCHNVLEQFAACYQIEDEIVKAFVLNRVV